MRLTPPGLAACVVLCVEDVKTGTALIKQLAALDVDYPEVTVDGDEYAGSVQMCPLTSAVLDSHVSCYPAAVLLARADCTYSVC